MEYIKAMDKMHLMRTGGLCVEEKESDSDVESGIKGQESNKVIKLKSNKFFDL